MDVNEELKKKIIWWGGQGGGGGSGGQGGCDLRIKVFGKIHKKNNFFFLVNFPKNFNS